MPSRKGVSKQGKKIEALFLTKETVTVREMFEVLYGDPGERTNREMSQAISPVLTRLFRLTGGNVKPTGEPYTYSLEYA